MHIITKEFTFEAAHRLEGHPKCGRLHGHSYVVIVELISQELPETGPEAGMVVDYANLDGIRAYINTTLDHRYLVGQELILAHDCYYEVNPEEAAVLDVYRTTAESLARMLFKQFKDIYPELTAVTVCETAKTSATYRFERGLR